MKGLALLLPVLVALQVGVQPALAWAWPVDGPVLRPFVLGDDPYAGGQHRGIDIGAPAGTPVRAPATGSISFAGTVPTGGKTITIRTADGYAVTLQHLGAYSVSRGAEVSEGDAIASVGEEADSFVYLGVRHAEDDDGYVDPLGLLPAPAPAPGPPDPAPAHPDPLPAQGHGGGSAKHHHPLRAPHPTLVAEPSPTRARELPHRHGAGSARVVHGLRGRIRAATHRRERPLLETRPSLALPASVPVAHVGGIAPRPSHAVSVAASERPRWPFLAGAALVALGLVGRVRLARRRRELRDAGAADRAPAVLLQRAATATEDAHGLRLGQENHVVLDRDLERILLAEREALADLDRNDDPAEVVDMANDPRSRCSPRSARPDSALRCSVRPHLLAFRSRRTSGSTSPRFAISNHHLPLRGPAG
jgi:hypothetical protein